VVVAEQIVEVHKELIQFLQQLFHQVKQHFYRQVVVKEEELQLTLEDKEDQVVAHLEQQVLETYLHFHPLKETQEDLVRMVEAVAAVLVAQDQVDQAVVEQQQLY
jgi:hypothetical protein